jgi:predicted CxxxxCH...CXXCH cytochrome family protein
VSLLALSIALAIPAVSSQTKVCAPCHPAQAKGHSMTLMAKTLEAGDSSAILREKPQVTYKLDRYSYLLSREGESNFYSVTDGVGTIKAPVRWVVGQGSAGQTYVLERDGKLFESWVSYYNALNGLGVTIGTPPRPPANLEEAFGREMKPQAVSECFVCHSSPRPATSAAMKGTLEWAKTLDIGVQCENCHPGAWKHASARSTGDMKSATLPSLKQLTAEELSDLCGACHRTWEHITLNGPHGVGNVRFQPYRIAHSKCYDPLDSRSGCITCHDAHNRPEKALAAYDSACLNCHHKGSGKPKAAVRLCKQSQANCVSCHMPKYEIPGSHYLFTDHFIRIVRPHETYPD